MNSKSKVKSSSSGEEIVQKLAEAKVFPESEIRTDAWYRARRKELQRQKAILLGNHSKKAA